MNVDSNPENPPEGLKRLEYNLLQDLQDVDKISLLEKDHRYGELFEKPSPLVQVVYCEKMLEWVKLHSKLYRQGQVTIKEIIDHYLGNRPPKEKTMEELNVYRSNAIHFIRR